MGGFFKSRFIFTLEGLFVILLYLQHMTKVFSLPLTSTDAVCAGGLLYLTLHPDAALDEPILERFQILMDSPKTNSKVMHGEQFSSSL